MLPSRCAGLFLSSMQLASCDSTSSNTPAQQSGGATAVVHTSGGSSTLRQSSSSGGATNASAGATSWTGGSTADAGSSANDTVEWMDPKCGGLSSAAASEPCNACDIARCSEELTQLFGSDWETGTPTGSCSNYLLCVRNCSCGNKTCYSACSTDLENDGITDPACGSSVTSLAGCIAASCADYCFQAGT